MHNPLRSESDVFRAVIVIVLGAAAVIALTEIAGQTAGAVLLLVLVLVGIAVLWRRAGGEMPRKADVTSSDDDVYRILVVANETVGGRALLDEIRDRCRGKRSDILVVVPALTSSQLEHWASDTDGAIADAQRRLDDSLEAMAEAGLHARGHVGDHHEPNASIEDALREFPADEVVISTHPAARSRWLERGVVERARRDVPLPVTHVIVDLDAEVERAGAAS